MRVLSISLFLSMEAVVLMDVDLDKENAAVQEATASRAPFDKRERRTTNVAFGEHRPPLESVHASGLARGLLDRSVALRSALAPAPQPSPPAFSLS